METFIPSDFQILMVDDNPKNLQLLGATLRNEGYMLEFAINGQTALNWLSKKAFDLILLDIMMPEISGFEVAAEIRKNPKLLDVPIIFLTAKADRESILHGFRLGAQDYIAKPFDAAELLARVRTQLELRHHRKLLLELNKNLEQKVLERTIELQEANDKLSKANSDLMVLDNAKTEFLHIIAHEIRTPLNGIKGSVEIMKEFSQIEAFKMLFEILEISVERLEKFSINALKITQLRLNTYSFDKQDFPLDAAVKTSVSTISNHKKEKNLSIKTSIYKNNITVFGDEKLITNCITIILDNAINFSPDHGKIFVSVQEENNWVRVEVMDQGPGFSEKAMGNLFRLFAPGEKHINENEGLELALAKLIADAHKGKIEIKNTNPGASVSILLPLTN